MSIPTTVVRSVPRIMDNPDARDELRDGLLNALAELRIAELEEVGAAWHAASGSEPMQHPDVFAWERMTSAAANEVLADVAALLEAAIGRRLPWEAPRG